MGASVGFTWGFEPEEGIDCAVASFGGWEAANASTTRVAPVRAIASHVSYTIAASVDDEVWLHTSAFHLFLKELYVVELRVAAVPLALESAWVLTARFALVLPVQAVVVSSWSLARPRAHLTERLIVGNVSGKSSE